MQVIFNETGEIRDVANGYARNYLFPKGLAVAATKEAIAATDAKRQAHQESQAAQAAQAAAVVKQLTGLTLAIAAKANEDGTLFAAITPELVVEAAAAQQCTIEASWVSMEHPIKQTGSRSVTVNVPGESAVVVRLVVTAAS